MFPFGWKKEKDIVCKGLHSPSDKFIVKHGNSWFLFVSDAEGGGQLKLYFSTDMKTWTKHPQSPILKRKTLHRILNKYLPYCVYKTKPWRLGGGPAKLHDSLVVPLQHWFHKKIYGEAVSLLVITKLTQDKIASSLSTNPFLFPDSGEKWRSVGSHHFSLAIDEDGRKVVATDGFDGKVWSSAIEKVGSGFQLGSVL
jgi:hypothetical protein